MLGSLHAQAGAVEHRIQRKAGAVGLAHDLHYEFDMPINVSVVDINGNTIANPGPFAVPASTPAGSQTVVLSGGAPGTVAAGGWAPTQPGPPAGGANKYRFTAVGSGTPKIKKGFPYWTDPNGAKIAMTANDCGPEGENTFDSLDLSCVPVNPSTIPTLSEWGLIILTGLLLIGGTMMIMRRRSRTTLA
jgi:hypothetical protein